MHPDSTTRRVLTVTLEDQGQERPADLGPCSAQMTTGNRRRIAGSAKRYAGKHPGTRRPCPNPAVKVIAGKPYCAMHGPTRYRIDPFYDSRTWRGLRQQTLERDGYVCQYCGAPAHQADHVVPRGKGGPDALPNLVACCRDCNKLALGAEFPSFEAKKAWIAAQRKRFSPKKANRRPTDLLDAASADPLLHPDSP